MKPWLFALLLIGIPVAQVQAADAPAITFYVQLVRGSDLSSPPAPQAHLIGPRLDRRLHDIFKWKNYWEIKQESATLKIGTHVRKQISPSRAVEISWPGGKNMTVAIYTNGKVTRKRQQSINNTFYIAGGDNDSTESWFIVVRRDKPGLDHRSAEVTKLAEMP